MLRGKKTRTLVIPRYGLSMLYVMSFVAALITGAGESAAGVYKCKQDFANGSRQ